METSYGNYLILIVALVSATFSVILFWKAPKDRPNRTSFLWKLILIEGVVFSFGIVILITLMPQSWLNVLSWVVFDFLISYVFCVEIPGYLKILKFDRKAAKTLEELREELIKMRYSFGSSLEDLRKKVQGNVNILEEEKIKGLLSNFIVVCDRLGNLDLGLWSLALNETSSTLNEIEGRSKHPFPKLVDILSLSGLSILLAQFLQLFK